MNIAIVFARGPEKSERNINMYLVDGHPLVYYCINAALNAKGVDKVFVSTNNKEIIEMAEGLSCELIKRPPEFSLESKGMGEAIVYSVKDILGKYSGSKNFLFLPGNTVMISPYLIEKSLEVLDGEKNIQSVITVWKSRHDHPRFALVSKENKVKPFLEEEPDGNVYFHDGTICAIRREVVEDHCFKDERWWMRLPNCHLIVRPWSTGRDVHDSYDLGLARWWMQNSPIDVVREVR